ncbi:hypothetical protein J6590_004282 [Homalodisca vitripennis]|nr:hypothetical protein J6590_004282 [Homalodisca vitripennis]
MTVNSSIHQDITGQSSGVTMTEVPYRNEAGGGGESNVDQTTSLSPTSQRTTSGSRPVPQIADEQADTGSFRAVRFLMCLAYSSLVSLFIKFAAFSTNIIFLISFTINCQVNIFNFALPSSIKKGKVVFYPPSRKSFWHVAHEFATRPIASVWSVKTNSRTDKIKTGARLAVCNAGVMNRQLVGLWF